MVDGRVEAKKREGLLEFIVLKNISQTIIVEIIWRNTDKIVFYWTLETEIAGISTENSLNTQICWLRKEGVRLVKIPP